MPEDYSQGDHGAGEGPVPPPSGAAVHTMICPACSTTYAPATRFCPLDGSILRTMNTEEDNLVGTILDGRYHLVEKLGQGGMGEVYLGEHVLTRRRCAVKVVKRILAADPEAFGRFIREATNAGRINHPHVATIYDFDKTDDGSLYLAMEYVDGEPLASLLEREGVLPPARAVEIARQVAEAVSAAHELGIVHRDLKPGNILVGRDRKGGDMVKVVDFGIARATADEQQHLTRAGFVVGTPEYMSPEQLIGDPVDGRSDVYALGCILYQMLTGQHAFGGSTARLITRRLTEQPPRPRDTNPAIPKALDDAVVTALGRLPQERYQTMDALHDALLAAPAQPVTTGPRRLASWLGIKHGKDHEGRPAASETAPRPVSATAGRQKSTAPPFPSATAGLKKSTAPPFPGATAGLQKATAPPFEASVAPEEPVPEPVSSGEHDVSALVGEVDQEGVASSPPDVWEPTAEPRRRSIMPKVAIGAGAVVVLLAAAWALQGGGAEPAEVAAPTTETTIPAPLPPAPPPIPESVIAGIRAELSAAEQENANEQFGAAIVRLRGVESTLAGLSASHPDVADVQVLSDSTHAQLARVEKRCNTLRELALARRETPPVCEVTP